MNYSKNTFLRALRACVIFFVRDDFWSHKKNASIWQTLHFYFFFLISSNFFKIPVSTSPPFSYFRQLCFDTVCDDWGTIKSIRSILLRESHAENVINAIATCGAEKVMTNICTNYFFLPMFFFANQS